MSGSAGPRDQSPRLQIAQAPEAAGIEALEWGGLPAGAELPALSPIFPRIDKDSYLGAAAEKPPKKAVEKAKNKKAAEPAKPISMLSAIGLRHRASSASGHFQPATITAKPSDRSTSGNKCWQTQSSNAAAFS